MPGPWDRACSRPPTNVWRGAGSLPLPGSHGLARPRRLSPCPHGLPCSTSPRLFSGFGLLRLSSIHTGSFPFILTEDPSSSHATCYTPCLSGGFPQGSRSAASVPISSARLPPPRASAFRLFLRGGPAAFGLAHGLPSTVNVPFLRRLSRGLAPPRSPPEPGRGDPAPSPSKHRAASGPQRALGEGANRPPFFQPGAWLLLSDVRGPFKQAHGPWSLNPPWAAPKPGGCSLESSMGSVKGWS